MSRVTNISGAQLDVPLLNCTVAAGATVDVPDVQADGVSPVIWPDVTWQPVV